MKKNPKIFVAGDKSILGGALVKYFKLRGIHNILSESICRVDLMDQNSLHSFFKQEKPDSRRLHLPAIFYRVESLPKIFLFPMRPAWLGKVRNIVRQQTALH